MLRSALTCVFKTQLSSGPACLLTIHYKCVAVATTLPARGCRQQTPCSRIAFSFHQTAASDPVFLCASIVPLVSVQVSIGGDVDAADRLVASGKAKSEDFRFFLHLCGWAPGQLQREIDRGIWFAAASSANVRLATAIMPGPARSISGGT